MSGNLKNNMKVDENTFLSILQDVYTKKDEERNLALDKYRQIEQDLNDAEQFAIMGKQAAAYLEIASKCTNDIKDLAEKIKDIMKRDNEEESSEGGLTDEEKRQLTDIVQGQSKKEKGDGDGENSEE